MFRWIQFLLVIGGLAVSTVVSANSALTGETVTGVDKRRWTAVLDTNHTYKTRKDQESFTGFTGRFDYQLTKTQTLRVIQFAQKNYEIDSRTQEVAPSDTFLFHLWRLPYSLSGESYQWVNSFTLPVSQLSQDTERITRFTSQMRVNYSAGRFFFSLRPSATYFWHKYKNASTTGQATPLYGLGVSGLVVAQIHGNLSGIISASYTNIATNASQFSSKVVEDTGLESDFYTFSMLLNYDWSKNISTYANYTNGFRSILNEGTFEVSVYDPQSTQYGIGLTLTY